MANKNVGRNIKALRIQRGLTQDSLAEKLFVSRQTVSNYETGKSNPDIDMLVKIAEILETDVNVLIFGPAKPENRKRELQKLAVGAGVLLVLLLLLAVLAPMAEDWRLHRYDIGLSLVIDSLLRPAFYGMFGWVLMQGISIGTGAKRRTGRAARLLFYGAACLCVLYGIIQIPFCIERLYESAVLYRYTQLPPGQSWTWESSSILPIFWQDAVFKLFAIGNQIRFACLPIGMILWNGAGRTEEDKTAV